MIRYHTKDAIEEDVEMVTCIKAWLVYVGPASRHDRAATSSSSSAAASASSLNTRQARREIFDNNDQTNYDPPDRILCHDNH